MSEDKKICLQFEMITSNHNEKSHKNYYKTKQLNLSEQYQVNKQIRYDSLSQKKQIYQQQFFMQNQQIGQKLSNISSFIDQKNNQQQQLQQSPYLRPSVNNQSNPFQQITIDQQLFQRDALQLLNKLNQTHNNSPQNKIQFDQKQQQQSTIIPLQPFYDNEIMNKISPYYSTVQPIQSPKENVKWKTLQQAEEQLQFLTASNNDLKKALLQSNNRINQLQKQIENLMLQNDQLKQQLITEEQNKIVFQKNCNEEVANIKQKLQNEIDKQRNQYNDIIKDKEKSWQQKYQLKTGELEQTKQLFETKVNSQQKEINEKQLQLNQLLYQTKELTNQLERRVQELHLKEELLSEKQLQNERIQNDFDQLLDKYEINTKELIEEQSKRVADYEQQMEELKQHNIILSQQIINLENQQMKDIENLKVNYFKEKNLTQDEVQSKFQKEKMQICQEYEKLLENLRFEKDHIQQTKDQQQLFLEQKITVLSQEYKTAIETVKQNQQQLQQQSEKIQLLETQNKNLIRENSNQKTQLSLRIQELEKKIGFNFDSNSQKSLIIDLEGQLQQKKNEQEQLINSLNQVIAINKNFETQIHEFRSRYSSLSQNNEKENEAYFNQIKQQKQTIADLEKKLESYTQNEVKLNIQISNLKNLLSGKINNPNFFQDVEKEKEINKLLTQKTNEYKQQVIEYEKKISKLQEQLSTKDEEHSLLEKEINQLKNSNNEMKKQFTSEGSSKQLEQYTSQISQLMDETSIQKNQIESLQNQLKQVRKDKARMSMTLMGSGLAKFQSNISETK